MRYTLLLLLLPILSLAQRTEDEAYRIIREALVHPESITELDLSGYGINYLPPEIGQFTNLEKLWLQHNRLSELPPSIGNLNKLKHLSLEANSLYEVPAEFWRLSSLERLWLNKNGFSYIDPGLGNLSNLKWLILDENPIYRLPSTVGKLVALEELWLQVTELRSLPESITNLTALKKLMLWGNPLEQMPADLHNMVSLESLDLRQTDLWYSSSEVSRLKWEMPHCEILYDGYGMTDNIPEEEPIDNIVFGGINGTDLNVIEDNNGTMGEGQGGEADNGNTYGFGGSGNGGTLLSKGSCSPVNLFNGTQIVKLKVCIDHNGNVESIKYAGGTTQDANFVDAAKCAVRKSQFRTKGMTSKDDACGTFTFTITPGGVSF